MADNLTLLELHLHAEDNEFTSDLELTSDVGDLVRDRLGFGGESDDEQSSFAETDFGTESGSSEAGSTSAASADGGNTVQVGESDEDGDSDDHGAVVEIDETADEDEDEESGSRSKTKALFTLVLLVGFAILVRRYLGDDDFEDEFEEL